MKTNRLAAVVAACLSLGGCEPYSRSTPAHQERDALSEPAREPDDDGKPRVDAGAPDAAGDPRRRLDVDVDVDRHPDGGADVRVNIERDVRPRNPR